MQTTLLLLAFGFMGTSVAIAKCVERATPYQNYATTRAWLEAGHAASVEYISCMEKEHVESERQYAERVAAKKEQEAREKAARDFLDKASERAAQGAVEAHGDVALGVGGPRDANVDRVGNAAAKAVGHVPQANGLSARLADIATRSAVDVNSRAMGSFQTGMKEFGGVDAPPANVSSLPPPSFAHVSTPPSEPDIGSFSGALNAAAREVGARGASDMRVSDQQLQRSGIGNRISDSVQSYNTSIDRSNEAINAQRTADAQFLNRFHDIRDNGRANAAAHRNGSSSSATSYSASSGSSTYSTTASTETISVTKSTTLSSPTPPRCNLGVHAGEPGVACGIK